MRRRSPAGGPGGIIAALWPERGKAMVSVSGYLIGSRESNRLPLSPAAELAWWYQYYFATERDRAGYEANRHDFAKFIRQLASPKWDFDDATFDRAAAAFGNPDHVSIVLRDRWRLSLAKGSHNMTSWKRGLQKVRSSPCPPLPSKAMPTVHHARTAAPTPGRSRASTRTGSSGAASATFCPRKPRRHSPTRSPTLLLLDGCRPSRRPPLSD